MQGRTLLGSGDLTEGNRCRRDMRFKPPEVIPVAKQADTASPWAWHALPASEVVGRLEVDVSRGLSTAEAVRRLAV